MRLSACEGRDRFDPIATNSAIEEPDMAFAYDIDRGLIVFINFGRYHLSGCQNRKGICHYWPV